MKLAVLGLGMAAKLGKTADIEALLCGNRCIDPHLLRAEPTVALEIPADLKISPQLIRRMNHLAKISLVATGDALRDCGLVPAGKSVGIIQGSVYGPIISGLQAFDELIDFGDNQLSPTNFSGSVFNTSATYLSLALGIQGCNLAHTGGLDTLYNTLLTAALWLESNTVDYVIAGVGDELPACFAGQPATSGPTSALFATAEGWTTFILGKDSAAKYGQIEFGYAPELPQTTADSANIYSLWHEQCESTAFLDDAAAHRACFPVFLRGSYPSAAAFDLALALLCVKNGRFPVYQPATGNYQVEDLTQSEPLNCFSIAENQGVHYYQVLRS